MNDFRRPQRELIGGGPQRLHVACGALWVAVAMTGPAASSDDGGALRLQIRPAGVVSEPATVSGATPPPPPLPELRFPVIRPGAAAHSADAAAAHEIRIGPEDDTHQHLTPGPGGHALPIIAPNGVLPAPVTLGRSIEIVPQERPLREPSSEAADPAEPREPPRAASPEVQIRPAPQASDDVELPYLK